MTTRYRCTHCGKKSATHDKVRPLMAITAGELIGDAPTCSHREFLWDLLDDIDTYDDLAKGDEKLYRSLVRRAQKRRFEVASSDGHRLTWRAETVDEKSNPTM